MNPRSRGRPWPYILSHKISLNRYKKIERTPCVLSHYHRLKPDFKNTNNKKSTNSWKLNNFQLDYYLVKEEIKMKIKDFPEFNEKECTTYPNSWDTNESNAKRNVHSSVFMKNLERSHSSNLTTH